MEQSTGWWVFAGLTLRAENAVVALYGSTNWRFVANDMSCPTGDGPSACFETGVTSNVKLLGNTIHDTGKPNASALYHGVYFSTDSNHIEVAWNHIYNVHGCRGIQFHSSPLQGGGPKDPTGRNQYDLSVHDNLIHDTQCDAIIFATVDPSKGKVEAYNNVIYNAGKGPKTPEGSGNWACIYAPGYTNTGSPGGGTIEVYNNTLVNCGSFANPPYENARHSVQNGGVNPNLQIRVRNNILVQPNGIPYVNKGVVGTNNLLYGGSGPDTLTKSILKDPHFVNPGISDFRIKSTSPARKAGVETEASTDIDGFRRSSAVGIDLGAYQYVDASVSAIRCESDVIVTPNATTCLVQLASGSPEDAVALHLRSDDPALKIPETLEIPTAAASLQVKIEASEVNNRRQATLYGGTALEEIATQLWLLPPGDVDPLITAVVGAATYEATSLVPGSLITLFGRNLGPEQGVAFRPDGDLNISTQLGGSRVLFGDAPGSVLYASAGQITAEVPWSLVSESDHFELSVQSAEKWSNKVVVPVAAAQPQVFTASDDVKFPLLYTEDNELRSAAVPVRRGSMASLLVTGLGNMEPQPSRGRIADSLEPRALNSSVRIWIDGVPVDANAYSDPGSVQGVLRLQFRVPDQLAGSSQLPIRVESGGAMSQGGLFLTLQ